MRNIAPLGAYKLIKLYDTISVPMLIYSVGGWLFTNAPVGWASQTTIILVLGSGQLLVLGIVGEYLG